MKKNCIVSILVSSAALFWGCNSISLDDRIPAADNGEVSILTEVLSEFQRSTSDPATRGILEDIEVIDVERRTYTYDNDGTVTEVTTRSGDDEAAFVLLNVRFRQGETLGYAFMTEDDSRIYFFTDNGSINDTVMIKPLQDYLNSVPDMIAAERTRQSKIPGEGVASPNADLYETILPLMRFAWFQGYPFNYYADRCGGEWCKYLGFGENKPIGCVTVAVGQVIATVGKYSNDRYDFSTFPSTADKVTTEEEAQKIGSFMREVAEGCNIKYGCEDDLTHGSSGTAFEAYNYLCRKGYGCEYVAGADINPAKLETNLRRGYPHLRCGKSSSSYIGHMWVIDGMRLKVGGGGSYYYHCNWGWGGSSNGWSYNNPYTPTDNPDNITYDRLPYDIYISSVAFTPSL